MKKLVVLVIIVSLLLQSCLSYRTIDKKAVSISKDKKYKITVFNKQYKGRITSFTDSVITLKTNNKIVNFKTEEISLIKQQKFSLVKTILFLIAISAVIVGLFVATYNPDIKVGNAPN